MYAKHFDTAKRVYCLLRLKCLIQHVNRDLQRRRRALPPVCDGDRENDASRFNSNSDITVVFVLILAPKQIAKR